MCRKHQEISRSLESGHPAVYIAVCLLLIDMVDVTGNIAEIKARRMLVPAGVRLWNKIG